MLSSVYALFLLSLSIDMAVQVFAQARPPGIYKGHYITDLFKQYGDLNDAIPPPELPDWCKGLKYIFFRPSKSLNSQINLMYR